MRETRCIMGMPVSVEIVGSPAEAARASRDAAFDYFRAVDERFSTYKEGSEIARINRGELLLSECSAEMREIFALAEDTKKQTRGYFDIRRLDGTLDPSGIVKGWAIQKVAELLRARGHENFYVDAGGDIQSCGVNSAGREWRLGIRDPHHAGVLAKVVCPRGAGLATSGTYIRGAHLYDPHTKRAAPGELVSLSVIGPNVYEADRFATAAFAMGRAGLDFIDSLDGFEAYAIERNGSSMQTRGFDQFTYDASDR